MHLSSIISPIRYDCLLNATGAKSRYVTIIRHRALHDQETKSRHAERHQGKGSGRSSSYARGTGTNAGRRKAPAAESPGRCSAQHLQHVWQQKWQGSQVYPCERPQLPAPGPLRQNSAKWERRARKNISAPPLNRQGRITISPKYPEVQTPSQSPAVTVIPS